MSLPWADHLHKSQILILVRAQWMGALSCGRWTRQKVSFPYTSTSRRRSGYIRCTGIHR